SWEIVVFPAGSHESIEVSNPPPTSPRRLMHPPTPRTSTAIPTHLNTCHVFKMFPLAFMGTHGAGCTEVARSQLIRAGITHEYIAKFEVVIRGGGRPSTVRGSAPGRSYLPGRTARRAPVAPAHRRRSPPTA